MNPRRMLASLGPRSPGLVRMMLRSAGGPCATDVAGALGYASLALPHPLYLQVYLVLWCPDYAQQPDNHALVVAGLAAHLGREIAYRRSRHDRRRPPFPACPPQWAEDPGAGLRKMAHVALFELQNRRECDSCAGFGVTAGMDPEGHWQVADCGECMGVGFVPYSKALRAQMLMIRRRTYEQHLHDPYVWLLSATRRMERRAASAHHDALDGESLDANRSACSSAAR